MADYVETTEDNGGVHLNSGIPNRAFFLAATAIGGRPEGAGRIWYAALTGASAPTPTSPASRGHRRGRRRARRCGHESVDHVGVDPGASSAGRLGRRPRSRPSRSRSPAPAASPGAGSSGAVDLTATDLRASDVRDLVDRIDFSQLRMGTPQPDRYVYEFRTPTGERVVVQEQDLTDDLRRLASLVLDN